MQYSKYIKISIILLIFKRQINEQVAFLETLLYFLENI